LTIEQGTAFHNTYSRGGFVLPDDELAGALYEQTQETLSAAGMPAYEISNHARPGEESRHNLTYWRYDDYVGVGPGAHGRVTADGHKRATTCHRSPEAWLTAVESIGHGIDNIIAVTPDERLVEVLMMGLRLTDGISVARFVAELGAAPRDLLNPRGLSLMIDGGFVILDGARLAATPAGLQRLNAVLEHLLP
jgi:oxygen-independent coproporphyrinogen-3 oxidase